MTKCLELKIPPVVVMLIIAGLMYIVRSPATALSLSPLFRWSLVTMLVCGGMILGFIGVWQFKQAQTTVNPAAPHKASVLVTHGVYAFTRNPMYLGLLISLLGWALFLSNAMSFIGLLLFVIYLNRWQIAPEERSLAQLFSQQYVDYCQRVRPWL